MESRLAHNQEIVSSIPTAAMIIALLFWQFSREHVDLLDRRWLGKKFARLGHQGSGNFARKMCLASGFVGKDVEDSKCIGTKADREPRRCGRFLLDKG